MARSEIYMERNLSCCPVVFSMAGVWVNDFYEKFQILEKKIFILFYFI